MKFSRIIIRNFKSIREMEIREIENALILVGKNNTGKTSVLDAIRMLGGSYVPAERDFNEKMQNIEVEVFLEITEEDLRRMHLLGIVSAYKRYEVWERDFCRRLPSFKDGILHFTFTCNHSGEMRFGDGYKKNNRQIGEVLPHMYCIDTEREISQFQKDLLFFQDKMLMDQLRAGSCLFDAAKECRHCFQCVGLMNRKTTDELTIGETARLLEYKLYQTNLSSFSDRVNDNFAKNGGYEEIRYSLNCAAEDMFRIQVTMYNREKGTETPLEYMGKGMRSIYLLSLLETYVEDEKKLPSVIVMEYPEMFLHPRLQKIASEILYRLSKKNQVIFTTHSPHLLVNFTSREIRQVVLDDEYYSVIRKKTDIDVILNDLGYAAGDFMNVDFVFIVEGKQDKSRLPLLLRKYYNETVDDRGQLYRIAIITTNSCTNIKTYANLKYMNQVYLKDQFLMIRDGDGKDPEELRRQLCSYYEEQSRVDADKLPRVKQENVLILRYYSFENYFLNPSVMEALGIVESEERFYEILWEKWNSYLKRTKSGQKLQEVLGRDLQSPEDVKNHMEEVRIHVRGHNLYDIFYGRYKKDEKELLERYLDLAPREDFRDILDAVDRFAYFDSRKIRERTNDYLSP
ncbi:MAG TPA: ATP-binding protein [Candidatus Lachnoclostridium stercorigallinarum]|uniref:ATP-binding protein n=1 Tax=Candidatus Lachnoclostridium stercorigallinarum TaxID=2838634 RepID=A0A9D2GKW3_9FIRM|nr:ATP-binding protein [Candidatus Lachnoclostridium stercorigallinarum]